MPSISAGLSQRGISESLHLLDISDTLRRNSVLPKSLHCEKLQSLYRITEVNNDFRVTYAVKPSRREYLQNLVVVPDTHARLFRFDVLPLQDNGGTLRIHAALNNTDIFVSLLGLMY